jgi:DNA-binding GntR family transcriptional regulator
MVTANSSDPAPATGRRVLRQEILLGLRSGILSGEIPHGTRLLEIPLSTELGVSRGPVREALRQLEQEGLVEFFPHRGAIVVGVADEEMDAIYGIRALLEERAFARACRVVDADELDALAESVERMIEASEAGDFAAVTEHDMRFHGRVVELSGFQYLRRLWTSIDGVVRLRAARDAERPEVADTGSARDLLMGPSVEHRDLVEALRSRRPATAAKAARMHISNALARLHNEERR